MVTFNDGLQDMDFGCSFCSSHSLISSVTFDEYYFYTATLSDNNKEGIKIIATSKRDFQDTYDPINKKYKFRKFKKIYSEYIEGNRGGIAYGKLGGILYFEKYELYCLIYAKIPEKGLEKNKIC